MKSIHIFLNNKPHHNNNGLFKTCAPRRARRGANAQCACYMRATTRAARRECSCCSYVGSIHIYIYIYIYILHKDQESISFTIVVCWDSEICLNSIIFWTMGSKHSGLPVWRFQNTVVSLDGVVFIFPGPSQSEVI